MSKYKFFGEFEEFKLFESEANRISSAIDEFRKEVINFDFSETFKQELYRSIREKRVNEFIEDNYNKQIKQILSYLNKKVVPFFFKLHLFKAILQTKEFNAAPFFGFISEVRLDENFVRVSIDKNGELKLYIHPEKINLKAYGEAVKKTREFLNIGKSPPFPASINWSFYYAAARQGLRIIKRVKASKNSNTYKEIDITDDYASRYWHTIRQRVEFFPKDSIPFFKLLQFGNKNVTLTSDRGGFPYPTFEGYDIIGNVVNAVKDEVLRLGKVYKEYIFRLFPTVEIDIDLEEITQEDIRAMFEDLLEKGIIDPKKKRLLNFKKLHLSYITNSIMEFVKRLGYEKTKVEVYRTKQAVFSIRLRMPDGKFLKWRGL